MAGKDDKGGRVGNIDRTKAVRTPDQIAQISKVGALSGAERVGKVAATSFNVRRPTRPMTAAERAELLRIVNEEAEKILKATGLPASHQEIARDSVCQALGITELEVPVEGDKQDKK